MLRVAVTVEPFGNAANAVSLGDLIIVNDGSGTPAVGNYDVTYRRWTGRVEGHDRSENVLSLISKSIDCLGEITE